MTFLLGFLCGVLFSFIGLVWIYRLGAPVREQNRQIAEMQNELLQKAVPVYQQATKILNTTEIDATRLGSLLYFASLLEDEIERQPIKTVN